MRKPYDGLGGADVSKIDTKDILDQKEFYQQLVEKHLFLETVYIKQHTIIRKNLLSIHKKSHGTESLR